MTPSDPARMLTRSQQARRQRIIDCAQRLFGQVGVRATTMEAVARESGVSKPTLYGYFRDKEALLEAGAFELFDRMTQSLNDAMEAEGNAEDRIVLAMQARLDQMYDLVIGSPFAQELLESGTPETEARYDALSEKSLQCMAEQIETIPARKGQGTDLAQLILRATNGLKLGARDRASLAREVEALVRGVIRQGI